MRFHWKPHYLFPKDLRHAHHDGYSILWAKTLYGCFMLCGAQYELSPSGDDIERFDSRKDLCETLARLAKKEG